MIIPSVSLIMLKRCFLDLPINKQLNEDIVVFQILVPVVGIKAHRYRFSLINRDGINRNAGYREVKRLVHRRDRLHLLLAHIVVRIGFLIFVGVIDFRCQRLLGSTRIVNAVSFLYCLIAFERFVSGPHKRTSAVQLTEHRSIVLLVVLPSYFNLPITVWLRRFHATEVAAVVYCRFIRRFRDDSNSSAVIVWVRFAVPVGVVDLCNHFMSSGRMINEHRILSHVRVARDCECV